MSEENKMNVGFLWVFVVLITITSYMTTAYFIHSWPFSAKVSSEIKTEGVGDLEFLKGMDEGSYEISNGKRIFFDGFSMVYPEDWVLMSLEGNASIVGVDPGTAMISVSISKLEINTKMTSSLKKFLGDKVDSWYFTSKAESVNFLDLDCTLFSGDVTRGESIDGMMVLAIPYDETVYLLTGVFLYDDDNQSSVDEIISTFRLTN